MNLLQISIKLSIQIYEFNSICSFFLLCVCVYIFSSTYHKIKLQSIFSKKF